MRKYLGRFQRIRVPQNEWFIMKNNDLFILGYEWAFQDPKMEVLFHMKPYFGDILQYRLQVLDAFYMAGTSN